MVLRMRFYNRQMIKLKTADTLISRWHKVSFNDEFKPAFKYLNGDTIYKFKTGSNFELYNILLEEYGTMNVNNMIVESLHPKAVKRYEMMYNKKLVEEQ